MVVRVIGQGLYEIVLTTLRVRQGKTKGRRWLSHEELEAAAHRVLDGMLNRLWFVDYFSTTVIIDSLRLAVCEFEQEERL